MMGTGRQPTLVEPTPADMEIIRDQRDIKEEDASRIPAARSMGLKVDPELGGSSHPKKSSFPKGKPCKAASKKELTEQERIHEEDIAQVNIMHKIMVDILSDYPHLQRKRLREEQQMQALAAIDKDLEREERTSLKKKKILSRKDDSDSPYKPRDRRNRRRYQSKRSAANETICIDDEEVVPCTMVKVGKAADDVLMVDEEMNERGDSEEKKKANSAEKL